MPEEQLTQLQEFIDMHEKFLGGVVDEDGPVLTRAAMETRAMALVLSGAMPPHIDLDITVLEIRDLLNDPAGLLPQKALMKG